MMAKLCPSLQAVALAAALVALAACGREEAAAPAPATGTEAPLPPAATSDAGPADLPAASAGPDRATDPLAWALAGPWRSDEERLRDSARNPAETLSFLGVEPDDVVIELWPGGGWYSSILAPYLATGGGRLIAAGFDPAAYEGERRERIEARLADYESRFAGREEVFGRVTMAAFSDRSGPLAAPESADVVLTFRNLHNWMAGGYADKTFADAYAALKPGGVLGVVEHRLPSSATQDPMAMTGYVHEDYVRRAAERAGFVFVDSSEVNANPKDTADHPFGVWTLPPNSRSQDRNGEVPEGFDPAIYQAIGESDRMTLKFVKPLADGSVPGAASETGADAGADRAPGDAPQP